MFDRYISIQARTIRSSNLVSPQSFQKHVSAIPRELFVSPKKERALKETRLS
jgi:hypothetical protein